MILKPLQLDLRSLAVCRMGLGLLLLLDLAFRAENFVAHYTDVGILPLADLWQLKPPRGISFHTWSAHPGWMGFCFVVNALLAVVFLFGYKTRWATLGCWLFAISLQFRNPLIIDGGDVLLRNMLFWFLFLPMGAQWSVDAQRTKAPTNSYCSWANYLLPVQLTLMYLFSALLKTSPEWWPAGTATGFALSLGAFTKPLGAWLLQYPEALKLLSRSTFLLELWGGWLLLASGHWRSAGVVLFAAFHMGLALTMDLALFPWIALFSLISLVPSELWDWVQKKSAPTLRAANDKNYSQYLALLLLATVVYWNITGIKRKLPFPKWIEASVRFLHIDQYWGMFSPYPLKDSGWYEFGYNLWDGSYIYGYIDDRQRAAWSRDEQRPHPVNEYWIDQRWRKYLLNLWEKDYAKHRPLLAKYLCRQWNDSETPMRQVVSIDVDYMLLQNEVYLVTPSIPRPVELGKFECKSLFNY